MLLLLLVMLLISVKWESFSTDIIQALFRFGRFPCLFHILAPLLVLPLLYQPPHRLAPFIPQNKNRATTTTETTAQAQTKIGSVYLPAHLCSTFEMRLQFSSADVILFMFMSYVCECECECDYKITDLPFFFCATEHIYILPSYFSHPMNHLWKENWKLSDDFHDNR